MDYPKIPDEGLIYLESLDDTVGKTITKFAQFNNWSTISFTDNTVLFFETYGYNRIRVLTEPLADLGGETLHHLGLISEAGYKTWEAERAKYFEHRDRLLYEELKKKFEGKDEQTN